MTGRQKLKLKQETAHSMELALDSLYSTLEALEEYVGKTGIYPNWDNSRQVYRKVIEDSNDTMDGFEDLFLTDLFVFKTQIRSKTADFREKIQKEFYKWIDAVGINNNNCPEKLKHYLFEFNEVLEGRGDNIVNQTRELIKGQELTPQEALGMFGQLNHQVNKGREREEILKGKKWNHDLGNENRINGNPERGKEILNQICQEIISRHGSYDLYSEQKKVRGIQKIRWDLISDIQHNKNDWEIRKNVAITYDRYGGEKKGDVLILKTARLGNRDYNQATGELINQPGKVYRQDYFNEKELAEINAIFVVSTPINQPIRWNLIDNIKQQWNEFKVENLLVSDGRGNYNEETWIIHNSAQRKSDRNGCLVFDSDKMVKDLNKAERNELGIQNNKLEKKVEKSVSSQLPKNNDNNTIGKGGVVAIVSVASLAVIGSLVAVKNKFNKKKG